MKVRSRWREEFVRRLPAHIPLRILSKRLPYVLADAMGRATEARISMTLDNQSSHSVKSQKIVLEKGKITEDRVVLKVKSILKDQQRRRDVGHRKCVDRRRLDSGAR